MSVESKGIFIASRPIGPSGRKEVGVKGTIFFGTKYASSMLCIFFLALSEGLVEE